MSHTIRRILQCEICTCNMQYARFHVSDYILSNMKYNKQRSCHIQYDVWNHYIIIRTVFNFMCAIYSAIPSGIHYSFSVQFYVLYLLLYLAAYVYAYWNVARSVHATSNKTHSAYCNAICVLWNIHLQYAICNMQ